MGTSVAYSGINTKVKAMTRRLISRDDYSKISNGVCFRFNLFFKEASGVSGAFSKIRRA